MQLRHRQKGLGWFGLLMVFGAIAFIAIVGAKCLPIYLNQFKLMTVLNKVATEGIGQGDDGGAAAARKSLERSWAIEDISRINWRDIKLKRTATGRALVYNYEAREKLFYNIFVVIHFEGEVPLSKSSAATD